MLHFQEKLLQWSEKNILLVSDIPYSMQKGSMYQISLKSVHPRTAILGNYPNNILKNGTQTFSNIDVYQVLFVTVNSVNIIPNSKLWLHLFHVPIINDT